VIWSVVVTYEAPDDDAASFARDEIDAVLSELDSLGALDVPAVAAVAPLVQFDDLEDVDE